MFLIFWVEWAACDELCDVWNLQSFAKRKFENPEIEDGMAYVVETQERERERVCVCVCVCVEEMFINFPSGNLIPAVFPGDWQESVATSMPRRHPRNRSVFYLDFVDMHGLCFDGPVDETDSSAFYNLAVWLSFDVQYVELHLCMEEWDGDAYWKSETQNYVWSFWHTGNLR